MTESFKEGFIKAASMKIAISLTEAGIATALAGGSAGLFYHQHKKDKALKQKAQKYDQMMNKK